MCQIKYFYNVVKMYMVLKGVIKEDVIPTEPPQFLSSLYKL